ncbi:MAG: signal peptidase I [bacterium]
MAEIIVDDNPFEKEPELVTSKPAGNSFVDLLQTVVIALVIVIVIYLFIMTPNEVKGPSMKETFQNADLLLTNKMIELFGGKNSPVYFLFGDYQRGDVIVFHEMPSDSDFIKRVIAIPDDKIKIQDGYVYVNGILLDETYLADGSIDPSVNNKGKTRLVAGQTFAYEGEELTVPEGRYFVMGDNRNNSKDSRYSEVGFVKREDLKGKVVFRYFPFDRLGIIQGHTYPELEK